MKIAVTGGNGLLGQHVVKAIEPDHEVSVLDIRGGGAHQPMGPVDLLDLAAVRQALTGHDALIHLGGLDAAIDATPEQFFHTNTIATWNVLHAGCEAGVNRYALCSSTSVYGLSKPALKHAPDHLPIDETHRLRASDPYGLSKRVLEEIGRGFAERKGISVCFLRPCYIAFEDLLPRLIRCKHNQPEPPGDDWVEPVPPLRWMVAPEDVASCFRLAIELCPSQEAFNVSAQDTFSSIPTRESVAALFGHGIPERDPGLFDAEPFASVIDTSKARTVLGWKPVFDWQALEALAKHQQGIS